MIHLQATLNKLIPCICMACDQPSQTLICETCCIQMSAEDLACFQCGERLVHSPDSSSKSNLLLSEVRCGRCLTHPPAYEHSLFAYRYAGAAAQLIQKFKFNETLVLSAFFAQAIVDKMHAQPKPYSFPEILVPIPLHPQRLKARGFNQSHELAKKISVLLGLPVNRRLISRTRATIQQTGLRRVDREKNIKGAFKLRPSAAEKIRGKHLALVDDVVTTGATVREAAKLLAHAKPAQISVFAIAKTQPIAKPF